MQGCVDLRKPNNCIWYEHFKMEGLHTVQQLIRRDDLITKVDLSDFYMHFLIGKTDRRYMRCSVVGWAHSPRSVRNPPRFVFIKNPRVFPMLRVVPSWVRIAAAETIRAGFARE